MIFVCLLMVSSYSNAAKQSIVLNMHPNQINQSGFQEIHQICKDAKGKQYDLGIGAIFSCLNMPRDKCVTNIKMFLSLSQQYDIPIVIQLDGEQWWSARGDLWNWWDPDNPGYNPDNRKNVEWTGWSPDDAIKIAWRNWGRQIRVLPPPNLMSPEYRKACHDEMRILVPIIMDWYKKLPPSKKHLLIGIKIGWESSIGTNSYYYPNGNELLGKPAKNDPTKGLNPNLLPSRGLATIGYAAVSTADIANSGELLETDLAEVVSRHLNDLCYIGARLGIPRGKMFTHIAGWKEEEILYDSALNKYACPGFSFYKYAADPAKDKGVQRVLNKSDAPYWAAVEWLIHGKNITTWKNAFQEILSDPKCRYVCIYNYNSIKDNISAIGAIKLMLNK